MGRYGNVVTGPKKTPANTVKNSMFSRAPQTPPRIASRPKPWPVRSSIPISGQPLGAGEQKAIGQFSPLKHDDLFDMEYWSLEQAKLGKNKPATAKSIVISVEYIFVLLIVS